MLHTDFSIKGSTVVHLMNDIRATQLSISQWLKPLVDKAGSIGKLARLTTVSKQTISRAIDPGPDYTSVMQTVNILKIASSMGVQPPAGIGAPSLPSGFSEPESFEISHNEVPEELHPSHLDQHVFRINTRAIELPPHGYMPGDIVMIDRTVKPQKNDVVCAQVIDNHSGTAETVWRVYDPPYLYPQTTDSLINKKPLTVDGESVDIVGPIIKSLRVREHAA